MSYGDKKNSNLKKKVEHFRQNKRANKFNRIWALEDYQSQRVVMPLAEHFF
jgi:hypothetical protein